MKNSALVAMALVLPIWMSSVSASPAVDALLESYRQQGATQFDAGTGQQLWNRTFTHSKSGQARSCASCHTDDPRKAGKHARTGKAIEAMAPSVNRKRLSDEKHMRKWFKRNCKWTMGRECTPREQGDVLMYLRNL